MSGLLNLPGVVETGVEEGTEHYVIHARSLHPVGQACRLSCKLLKNGTKVREINDVPHHGKATLIRYSVQRFACPDCVNGDGEVVGNRGLFERLSFVRPGSWMTKRLMLWLARQGMRRTFAEIAREVAIDPKTAAAAFDAYSDVEIAKLKRETPRVLGIDEKMLGGEFRAVLGNLEARSIVDMLTDRHERLELKLNEMAEDRRLEVVVTDRYDGYRKMIRRRLPSRLHVTDRFHITRAANQVLDQIRASVSKRLPDRREGARLRMSRQLFRMRWGETTEEQKATINDWCSRWSILHDAYWAKERYCDLYLCTSPAEAEAYYKNWLATLPPTVSLAYRTQCEIPRRWMPMVLAYFEEPYTTGYIESMNRWLDDLQRDGRGYSFPVMRAKLMLAPRLEKRVFRGGNRIDVVRDDGPLGFQVSAPPQYVALGIDLNRLIRLFEQQAIERAWFPGAPGALSTLRASFEAHSHAD